MIIIANCLNPLDNMYSIIYTIYSKVYIMTVRYPLELRNNLRKFRFEHNELTQQDLANAVDVTRLTIHSIETGKFNPSTFLALKIARFFEVNVEDIFFLGEDENE